MAENIRGTITRVGSPRQVMVKGKPILYQSFKVNDVWYSNGTKVPPPEGTLVEFAAEQNDKGYWNVTKAGIRVIEAEEPTRSVASVAVQTAATSHMSKEDYWRRKEERELAKEKYYEDKDRRIELQSCRNSAIELVKILVTPAANGETLIKLPAQAKREAFVTELVETYTQMFVAQNNSGNKNYNENTVEEEEAEERINPVPTDIDSEDDDWDA